MDFYAVRLYAGRGQLYSKNNNPQTNILKTQSPGSLTTIVGKESFMIDIEKVKPEIDRICRRLPVKRLGLFGSALTKHFSQSSDIDVLVIFDSGEDIDLFDKYFELKERLEEIFKRDVDLVVDKKFKNPVFRESVDRTRTVIYER